MQFSTPQVVDSAAVYAVADDGTAGPDPLSQLRLLRSASNAAQEADEAEQLEHYNDLRRTLSQPSSRRVTLSRRTTLGASKPTTPLCIRRQLPQMKPVVLYNYLSIESMRLIKLAFGLVWNDWRCCCLVTQTKQPLLQTSSTYLYIRVVHESDTEGGNSASQLSRWANCLYVLALITRCGLAAARRAPGKGRRRRHARHRRCQSDFFRPYAGTHVSRVQLEPPGPLDRVAQSDLPHAPWRPLSRRDAQHLRLDDVHLRVHGGPVRFLQGRGASGRGAR